MTAGPLVDTSVLIDYFAGRAGAAVLALDHVLQEGPIPCTAPLIVQEFLQGFQSRRDLATARRVLAAFDRLPPPGYPLHEQAAAWHRSLRAAGRTLSTADVLILAMAHAHGRPLLTADAQQVAGARGIGVEVFGK